MIRKPRTLRARLAITTAIALLGIAILSSAVILWMSGPRMYAQVDDEIQRDLQSLCQHHEGQGLDALAVRVQEWVTTRSSGEFVSLYRETDLEVVAGHALQWPDQAQGLEDAIDMRLPDRPGHPGERHVMGRTHSLGDGYRLAVGRDVSSHQEIAQQLRRGAVLALAFSVGVAILVGALLIRGLLARVARLNRTVVDILDEKPRSRVPVGEQPDEFDVLAGHFNMMLDRNERLLERIRGVSSDIAHDLRTPLSRLRARVDSALIGSKDEKDYRETLEQVRGEADAILDTFNAVLDIARIESGVLRERMEDLCLSHLVEETVELYAPAAEEAGLAIETGSMGSCRIRGDRQLLARALSNLIDNAIKYAPQGTLHVTCKRVGHEVCLEVRDQGPGIGEEDRERVLERFVRLDSTRGRSGNGLGLSLVAAVAELHGASLALEDADPGLSIVLSFEAREG